MSVADSALDTLRQATELNMEEPLRDGSLLRFPDYGQVVMTGALHAAVPAAADQVFRAEFDRLGPVTARMVAAAGGSEEAR